MRPEGLSQQKISMTPSGIKPRTTILRNSELYCGVYPTVFTRLYVHVYLLACLTRHSANQIENYTIEGSGNCQEKVIGNYAIGGGEETFVGNCGKETFVGNCGEETFVGNRFRISIERLTETTIFVFIIFVGVRKKFELGTFRVQL